MEDHGGCRGLTGLQSVCWGGIRSYFPASCEAMSIHATRGAGSRRTSGGLNLDHPFATFSGWSWEDAAMCLVTMGLMAVLPATAIFCGLMIWKDGVGEAPPKVDPRPRRTMLPRQPASSTR